MNYIKLFGEGVPNINLYGGKGANLIKLVKEGFDVPYGFIINTNSYKEFLESSEYSKQITELLTKEFNSKEILQLSTRLKSLILKSKIPEVVMQELKISYNQIFSGIEESDSFAVRSSATIEDSNIFSFAGQADTYLFINSFEDLLVSLKNCWASLFSPGALLYLLQMKKKGVLDSLINIRMAVVVQKMVESEISGVLFTVNVMTNNDNEMLINSTWGLGETIADNIINPDMIIINKENYNISNIVIGEKEKRSIRNPEGTPDTILIENELESRNICSLNETQLFQLCLLGKKIEIIFQCPQDIEWAIENEKIYILQTRPITTLNSK